MNEAILSVRVEKRVHPGLLVDACFEIGAERCVLFGPSGSGKSTLLRLMTGLDRPDAGRVVLGGMVLFDGEARLSIPPRGRGIGLIFQDDRLFPHLSVEDNLRFGLSSRKGIESDRRVAHVAELCGVTHLLGRDPSTLSGGERQRVGLARAITPRPRLLLCDEPVSALDLPGRFALIERIKAVQESEGIPLLYVTHSPTEALAIGTRLLAWDDGRVTDSGRPLDLLTRLHLGEAFENVLTGTLEASADEEDESRVRLVGGPIVIVPRIDRPTGSRLTLRVRADEIVLARGPIAGLSARNAIAGRVARVIAREREAEVVVATGEVEWVASVTRRAVTSLGLFSGEDVSLIIKSRSIYVLSEAPEPVGGRPS